MQTSVAKLSGSCLCRAVQFEIENAFRKFFLCHCYQCQKMTGSAHVANLFTNKEAITWLKGEHEVKRYTIPGRELANVFCSHCGSPVPHISTNGRALIVPAGSLDGEPSIMPHSHIFMAEKRTWHDEIDSVPQFAAFPTTSPTTK